MRDKQPERFLDAHEALFALRHDHGGHLRDEEQVRDTLESVGVDVEAVFGTIASGKALEIVRKEHEAGVASHHVWGVPTFVVGEEASFVRLMDRPQGDGAYATTTIDRIVDLLDWPNLNEFKHTSIRR